ncbi:KH domain-containing protein [Ligilactobacillus sp. LYQ60]|uniref:KH domain-containing protein n=1 Tax=unclassified Ligilactobacillus TaxID=2767920 RepID=UPI003851DDD4
MTVEDVKTLVVTLVKPLVTQPDDVSVTLDDQPDFLNLNLAVAPADIGRVIGKHGRVAQAIRTIIYSIRLSGSKRIRLNIVDD